MEGHIKLLLVYLSVDLSEIPFLAIILDIYSIETTVTCCMLFVWPNSFKWLQNCWSWDLDLNPVTLLDPIWWHGVSETQFVFCTVFNAICYCKDTLRKYYVYFFSTQSIAVEYKGLFSALSWSFLTWCYCSLCDILYYYLHTCYICIT